MDRLANSDGSLRLPVGYRFCPSDEVFVTWYLKKKALSRTTGVEIVPEFDVFKTEPKNLPSGGKVFLDTKYFFLNLKDHMFVDVDKRDAGRGHWKTVGKVKDLVNKNNNKLMGRRSKLIFWRKKRTQFVKTKWVMYEYRVFLAAAASNTSQMSSWAGYKIFLKKDKKKKRAKLSSGETSDSNYTDDEDFEDVEASEVNFAYESGINTGPPSPSSSESSVTSERQ